MKMKMFLIVSTTIRKEVLTTINNQQMIKCSNKSMVIKKLIKNTFKKLNKIMAKI